MKWSIVVSVVVAAIAVGGGAYYVIHRHEIRVEVATPQSSGDRERAGTRAREDIGTYKDAKHPSFPGPDKSE